MGNASLLTNASVPRCSEEIRARTTLTDLTLGWLRLLELPSLAPASAMSTACVMRLVTVIASESPPPANLTGMGLLVVMFIALGIAVAMENVKLNRCCSVIALTFGGDQLVMSRLHQILDVLAEVPLTAVWVLCSTTLSNASASVRRDTWG